MTTIRKILILLLLTTLTLAYNGPYKSPITIFSAPFASKQKCEVQCINGCDRREFDHHRCVLDYILNDELSVYECRCFDTPGPKQCHTREINGNLVCIS